MLDLGLNKNYKTKIIQDRWEKQRQAWLNPKTHENNTAIVDNEVVFRPNDPRDGVSQGQIPLDHSVKVAQGYSEVSLRKKIKRIMKNLQSPYDAFDSYYPLEEVIDTYMEIWY